MGWLGNTEVGPELRAHAPDLEGVPPHGVMLWGGDGAQLAPVQRFCLGPGYNNLKKSISPRRDGFLKIGTLVDPCLVLGFSGRCF